MSKCLNCGTINEDDAVFCKECGIRLTPMSGWTRSSSTKTCTSCGLQIPIESNFCKFCGQDYSESMSKSSSLLKSGNRSCVSCGREIDFESNYCSHCGYDYRDRSIAGNSRPLSKNPTVAGIINIVTGTAIIVSYFLFELLYHEGIIAMTESQLMALSFLLIPGILAIIGGVFCLTRIHWTMALIGSIAALVGLIAPGIASIILVAYSRDEFEDMK